ncbi:hypothetical protein [Microvirga pakistanensis]|uniref:hypothetical protein n=1 Tax=Microvirga pakistanensis TaxID=1682650 RepID=UPI0010694B6B|nr:hypothetical protein [Microvirga pakistanensis]
MTDDNLYASVRLPADRRGLIIKVHERENGGPPVYDIETNEGETITMVEIAEGGLIPRQDYDRLLALARGIEDGSFGAIDVTDWTE